MEEPAASVVARTGEREAIGRFLAGTWPAMLLADGEPGIGKTTLWQAGIDLARQRGVRVLAFRPGEAERRLAFAGLSGLFPDPVLDEVLPRLPEPRRRALAAALLRSGAGAAAQPGMIGLGVLSAVLALAREPLLLAVDDLQWLDESSVAALDFALRRLDGAPVGVFVTCRTAAPAGGPSRLEAAFTAGRRSRVHVGPLSHGALGLVIQDRLGAAIPRHGLVRLAEAARGNPFVGLELARSILDRGWPPPGAPIAPPADAQALVGARIGQLSADAAEALCVLASVGRPSAALLTNLFGEARCDAVLGELVATELATVDGNAVRCAHPLIASAAYARTLPGQRRNLHRRLAGLMADPEAKARHLALATAGHDEATARALDEATVHARRRGATVAAADLAELAVNATPPQQVAALADRRLALARHLMEAGSAESAKDIVVQVLDSLPVGPARVRALCLMTDILVARSEHTGVAHWHTQAVAEAGDDPLALAHAHVTAGMAAWVDPHAQRAHADAALAVLAGREDEAPDCAAIALALMACVDVQTGRGLPMAVLERAVELEPHTNLSPMNRPSVHRALLLGIAGRHHESIEAIRECLGAAERAGEWPIQPHLWRCLAWTEFNVGRLADARAHIEHAIALGRELDLDDPTIWGVHGQILAASGMPEAGRVSCEHALAIARDTAHVPGQVRALGALGLLELTIGNAKAAADALLAAEAIRRSTGITEPAWWQLAGDLVEALLAGGRMTEAAAAARQASDHAQATGHPWTILVAGRCTGLVEAAAGRPTAAIETLSRTLADPALATMRLEWGRTQFALGMLMRRADRRRAAREVLHQALATLRDIGAAGWVRQAEEEAGAISGRTAVGSELTAMQRRVARLAADGGTNGEIASELFLSVRTVESHLSATYRKLRVRSRTELAAALRPADGSPAAGIPARTRPADR